MELVNYNKLSVQAVLNSMQQQTFNLIFTIWRHMVTLTLTYISMLLKLPAVF